MKPRLIPWITLGIAGFLVALVILYVKAQMTAQANRPIPEKQTVEARTTVNVMTASLATYQAVLNSYGAAEPHYSLTLIADVSGKIESLHSNFEVGTLLKKGDQLLTINDREYRATLASAKEALASAQLSLLEEERQGQQASAEWKASGLSGDPASDLVLRKPQLIAAQATVASAKSALASAQQDVINTQIKAPFDALVIERSVSPGSYLQAGTELGALYSTDRVEIELSFSAQEWENLADAQQLINEHWPVTLTMSQAEGKWQGYVVRVEQHMDSTTRQRSLIVAVDQPLALPTPLLPGSFLKANIQGRSVAGLWKLPATALSQRGEIWYVTAQETLDLFTSEPQFSEGDFIYIVPPTSLAAHTQRIVVHPLSSYLKGMRVDASTGVNATVSTTSNSATLNETPTHD